MRLSATRLTAVASAARRLFNPRSLFASGEQGAWYDPSDLSTLFQDAAGTTPVTAVEQPVGLMLDKSKGLVLGPELVTNGTFDANISGWSTIQGDFIWNAGAGVLTVRTGEAYISQSRLFVIGKVYEIKCQTFGSGSNSLQVGTSFGSNNVAVTGYVGAGLLRLVFTANAETLHYGVKNTGGVGSVLTIDNISVRELPGNHAFQTTSTSRPVLKQDAGGQYYLKFDGVDDGMVTNSIDFTATDKMTVFAGVRRLGSSSGFIAELSANSQTIPGSMYLHSFADAKYYFRSHGTIHVQVGSAAYAFPLTHVLTGRGDISGDSVTLRVNGAQVAQSTADQGTGKYGNYPIYIGRRGGTEGSFNGHLYSLIVRGAQTTDTRIAQTERWVNKKTGAY